MSIFIISVIIVLIRSFLGVTSDDDCKFTSASLMPDGYFFTKDDKFWITKEGGKLSNPESISEKCKLSNLTRADIAVWWGRHPDDDDCNVGDQKTVYEKSFLLMEKSNDGTCKWCFLWGENEERRDTREENKLLTKWIKEAKPLCEGFDGIAMKSTDQIQITAIFG